MNKNFLIATLLIIILSISCATKPQKTIAIDVLLTLPDEVYHQAIQLNHLILEDHPNNFTLDENHIPHITLLQCYILKNNLPKVEKALRGLYKTVENDPLWVEDLQYAKDKEESFASLGIKRSKSLLALHKKAITLLKPFIMANGSQKSYIQNVDGIPIDQFTINYVPKFVNEHSFENYNPHISLGIAKTLMLDSLAQNNFRPVKFRATSISVYQLGAFGTAQKSLWRSE